ncbi:MAG: Rossmann-like domain-containing protein [Candidatus Helarchaeota archaeon]
MGSLIADLIKRIEEEIDLETFRIRDIQKGIRFTGTLLDEGSCGLCFSALIKVPFQRNKFFQNYTTLKKVKIRTILSTLSNVKSELDKIIGLSILNAISQAIIKKKLHTYHIQFDTDPIYHLSLKSTDFVVMIGAIGKLYFQLQGRVRDVIVIDDRLQSLPLSQIKSSDVKTPDNTQHYLNKADIVIITGSAFVNGTLESLLEWATAAREIAIVGPTAGFIPEPLFERGATMISGMQVLQPEMVLQIIAEDGGTPHFKAYCRKYNILK